jgi:nitronate monooxygenase
MNPWNFLGTELPIIQAPMAGSNDSTLVITVCNAGGLGSLPCATLSIDQIREQVKLIRAGTTKPFNLNFFAHKEPRIDVNKEQAWKKILEPYYKEFGIDPTVKTEGVLRKSFDESLCALVEDLKPPIVSFHFGLPTEALVKRVKASGALILSSATTVNEARWLEAHGCDAIIAQGYEAGGHRGIFLSDDLNTQVGTIALVPQIVDAVKIPVIASGGISDQRGVRAAFALGASAVQVGTAYLFCPEAKVNPVHRKALKNLSDSDTAFTNIFTGQPARGISNRLMQDLGPLSSQAPDFPRAGFALTPIRAKTEPQGQGDFMPLWSGQARSLAKEISAAELTKLLAQGFR